MSEPALVQGTSTKHAFRPRGRLLVLLGDQLIRDAGVAVFELVKNAYDADASGVSVVLENVQDARSGRITVTDDGSGMSPSTVTNVWLEPGTDNRGTQRAEGRRSPKFNRLPLGEKGVGRFAAHKLGRRVKMITRADGHPEVVVDLDWDALAAERYLEDAHVEVTTRAPKTFASGTGTRLEITGLRSAWTRGLVRNLHRAVSAIRSPFQGPGDFHPRIEVRPDYGWLEGLLDASSVLEMAPFRVDGEIRDGVLTYSYVFVPPIGLARVEPRAVTRTQQVLIEDDEVQLTSDLWATIGPVRLDLRIFDRDPQVFALTTNDRAGLRDYLNRNGGVRVYRDGVRVYNYGEPENDWLDLSGQRVNVPAKRIGNNQVIGAVSLSLDSSDGLVEKTNREGFVENPSYTLFRESVRFAMRQVEADRNEDKRRIRRAHAGRQKEPVLEDIAALRDRLEGQPLEKDVAPYLDRIERQFEDVRDRLLTAAGAGLTMAMVVHQLEKGVDELQKAVARDLEPDRVRELSLHLSELIEGLGYLTRRSGMSLEEGKRLARFALFNTEFRLRHHEVAVTNGFTSGERNFEVNCRRRLVIASIMNLIDNSIWWLETRPDDRRLYIGSSTGFEAPALVVADNGPGFMDAPETLVEPFVSRRVDGMGLGLHLADEVMKTHKGRLAFPSKGDIALPAWATGAVVAMVFTEARWMD